MARNTTETRTETKPPAAGLKAAYDAAMTFPVEQVSALRASLESLMENFN